MYYEREPEPLTIRRTPPAGAIYLQGYADGFYNRPAVVQRTKAAQKHYAKGYQAGKIARPGKAKQ